MVLARRSPHEPGPAADRKRSTGVWRRSREAPDGAGIAYDIPPGLLALRRQMARRAAEAGVAPPPTTWSRRSGRWRRCTCACARSPRPATRSRSSRRRYYGVLQLIESLGLKALEIPAHPRTGHRPRRARGGAAPARSAACLVIAELREPARHADARRRQAALVRLLARARDPAHRGRHLRRPALRRHAPAPRQGLRHAGAGDALRVVLEDARAWLPRRLTRAGPLPRAGRAAQVRPDAWRRATLPQMAIADFLEHGGYERHLRRLRRALAEQVARVSAAIVGIVPGRHPHLAPARRLVLWVEMPPGKNALDAARRGRSSARSASPPARSSAPSHASRTACASAPASPGTRPSNAASPSWASSRTRSSTSSGAARRLLCGLAWSWSGCSSSRSRSRRM